METTLATTLEQFINKHQLEIASLPIFSNPHMSNWSNTASHFQVRITQVGFGKKDPMYLFFSKGSALKGKPTLKEVLETIKLDSSVLDQSFDDFCDELGYSPDSLEALETYKACSKIARDFQKLIGRDAMRELRSIEE